MPFYEYECQACKFYTEVMQKISDPPLIKCPSCGKRRLKKLVSAPVFRLKGGGWYETDFKSDKESKRNLSGPDREEVKVDAKPEAKDGKPEVKDSKPEVKDSKPEVKDSRSEAGKAGEGKPAAPRPAVSPRRPAKSVRRKSARRTHR
jgi:putative FmdB family regulatory protein